MCRDNVTKAKVDIALIVVMTVIHNTTGVSLIGRNCAIYRNVPQDSDTFLLKGKEKLYVWKYTRQCADRFIRRP